MKRTFFLRKEDITRKWYIVDAKGQVLGRLASKVATVLNGKHKPEYTPHVDCGDYVIVINAKDVVVTGKKEDAKVYQRYSGYSGGLKETPLKVMRAKKPEDIIRLAVRRMLPKGRLGRAKFKKLFVYANDVHPHLAQKPELLEV